MRTSLLSAVILLGVLLAPGVVLAQPVVELDLDPSTPAIDRTLTISKAGAESARTFKVNLWVTGAVDMTGVAVDIGFAATQALNLIDVKSIPGDLNFDGSLALNEEVLPVINQFVDEFNFVKVIGDFVDGYGRNSSVVYNTNANESTDLDETLAVINQFIDEFNFAETPYWTKQVLNQYPSTFNESVQIADPVKYSNLGDPGAKHVGLIDDITAVLLKRPDRTEAFGFSGDALIVTLTFMVRSDATPGTYNFTFPQAVWIDKNFTGVQDIKNLALPATLSSITVTQ